MDDEKKTGASYIITFYQNVEALKAAYAQYLNLLLEFEAKYGTDDGLGEMTQPEKDLLNTGLQNLRYYAIQANQGFVSISAMAENIKFSKEDGERAGELYKHFKTKYIVEREIVEEYAQLMDKFMVANVIKGLLKSAQDIISKL